MSLQVWLPLTGNTDNLGLSNITSSSASGIIYSDGKIGKCLSASSNVAVTITLSNLAAMLANGTTYSLSCWVKITNNVTSGWVIKLGTNSCGLWWHNSEARWVWNENDNGKRCANPTISADTNWHHLVTTVDKTATNQITAKHYVDGLPASGYETHTWDCSSQSQPAGNTITISPYVAMLNDVRLYDHVLSPKEIKEISKGLVCHYPLDGGGRGQDNLSDFQSVANKWTNEGMSSMTNYSDSAYGNVLKLVNATANTRIYKTVSNVWKSGQTYTVSFLARATTDGIVCNMSRSVGDFTSNFTLTTEWKRYVGTINSTVTADGGTLSFRIVTATAEVYITNVKLENGNICTPYMPGTSDPNYANMGYDKNIEYDTSGYGNHGTQNNITYSTNSLRYAISSVFNGTSSYVNIGDACFLKDTISVSVWAYRDDWTDISYNRPIISCTQTGGWTIYTNTKSQLVGSFGTGESSNTYVNVNCNISDLSTGWNMITSTYDGYSTRLYVNGILKGTNTAYTTKTPLFYNNNTTTFIGAEAAGNKTTPTTTTGEKFPGNISDARIYATVLTDADILELYKTSASIDNGGNVFTGDFEEIIALDKPTIGQNSVIQNNEFDESDAMDLITYHNPTTGYTPGKDTSNSTFYPAQIVFDYDATETTASTIYRIIANVSWSGFDASSTAGTFNIRWQGSNRQIENSSWVWAGTNYVTEALNNKKSLKTLVLSATSGTFIYDATFTLPDNYRSTYNGSNIGFRTDYSNGTGQITVTNIKIILDKYSSTTSTKAHMGKDFMAGASFIEI